MRKHKRIFIVGHMGAGKGLVSKALAEKLGWQFINADLGLEYHVGRSLSEIVGKQGEETFHHCEAEILAHHFSKENIVVATDGGIVSTEKNRKLLVSEFVVYLKVSTPVQLERMSSEAPPLLPTTDHKAFLDKLHRDRDSLFDEVATLIIDTDDQSVNDVLSEIIKVLEK